MPFTAEQLASLPPEARLRYEQARQQREQARQQHQANQPATQEEIVVVKRMAEEEKKAHIQERQNPSQATVPMSPEDMQEIRVKIVEALSKMNAMTRNLLKMFHFTKDEQAIRAYLFRARYKLMRQYTEDGGKIFKDGFTVSKSEVDQIIIGLDKLQQKSDVMEMAKKREGQPAGSEPMGRSSSQQAPQPTPVAADKPPPKLPAGRPAPKAPAAPTTTHPPFGLRAHQSPAGEPQYFSKPPITQSNLQAPPPRKKAKTAPSPSVSQQGAGASPKSKVPSPDMRRQQQAVPEPPKPQAQPKLYPCSVVGCEMHAVGFSTEELRDNHYQEEHVRPFEDPQKFLEENMSLFFNVEDDETAKVAPAPAPAPAMGGSLSKQGQTPGIKEATPMSRDASMRRQGSAAGGPADRAPTPAAKESAEASWATTIDPQALTNTFGPMDTLNGNPMFDFGSYRPGTETPNDTPSGASEPNSDISEGAAVEIDMYWQPLGPDVLAEMSNMGMENFEQVVDPMQYSDFDFGTNDFSKPLKLQLDPSFYSLDPS